MNPLRGPSGPPRTANSSRSGGHMGTNSLFALAVAAVVAAPALGAAPKATFDTAKIEQLTGAKGSLNEKEGVLKASGPGSVLSAPAAGVKLPPPMGLTSWAAFKRVGKHAVVMGDIVMLEDQVNPVMSAAL